MKDDGEYAVDKGERTHRVASLVVFVGWVVAAVVMQDGGRWVRMALVLMMPVAWIWWPVAFRVVLEKWCGTKGADALPGYGTLVRWVAWILLMGIPVLLFNSRKWRRDRGERDEALRKIEQLQGRP